MTRPDPTSDPLGTLFRNLPRETVEGEACPTPEKLWASAEGTLDPETHRKILDHTGRCSSCAEDWRIARQLTKQRTAVATPQRSRPPRRLRPPRWLAAAALALMVGGGWWFLGPDVGPPSGGRGGDGEIENLLPADQPLSRTDPTLRWQGPPGAIYQVIVTTEALEPLVRAEGLTTPSYAIPIEALAELPAGTILLWNVRATVEDGATPAARTFRVRLDDAK